MKKSFLDKLACKKLVGKHVVLSDAYNFNSPVGYGTFSGIVKDVCVRTLPCGNIDIIILLDGFENEFEIDNKEFKNKVKITK